ncbi:MAG TPA: patatin-like phospholipase family protein, partial [Longimicrobium sp.]|nr:patatin-like phospholipase family protein [Longimicrobium sp.]
VLLVARADEDPAPGEVERGLAEVERGAAAAGRALVLVHPEGSDGHPRGTRRWLEARDVDAHHHLRWGDAADLARLARHLAGRSVGLVLGGGGARGFAHIGAVRALHELGIPVDLVAGTSMGAALAAQVAMGWSPEKMAEVNRRVWLEIRPHRVFTLPLVSVLSNARAEVCGRMMYGDLEIEDLWIPYFCVSASLVTAEAVVHRRGSLDRATAASTALPGIAPPILQDGHLLVDGALLNNLPADLMRAAGAGTVIAAEVSLEEDAAFTVERVPTTGELLRSRFGRGEVRFPSLMEVVMRASMLHSVGRQREALDLADLTLRPPVDPFGMMEFHRLEEIAEVGYAHAREAVGAWMAEQKAGAAVDFPAVAG